MASFKDVNGKERTVTLSLGALRRFEKKTGKKILRTVSKVIGAGGEGATEDKMIGAFGELLEDFDTLATLTYECSVPRSEQKDTSLDDFADALAGPALGACAIAMINGLTECVSSMPAAAALAGAGSSDPK